MEDTVPKELKIKRLSELIKIQQEISISNMEKRTGTEDIILLENRSAKNSSEFLGRTSRNEMVLISGSDFLPGTFFRVKLEKVKGKTFKGGVIKCLSD
jgi:tRNA-2-methylthio-N6-dimethylallyladenosine synthase